MSAFLAIINGRKTYIVAVLTGVFAAAQMLGYPIPEWVYAVLGAAGLGAVRHTLGKIEWLEPVEKIAAGTGSPGARTMASPWVMPFAIFVALALVLSGCARLEKASAGVEAGVMRFEAKGSGALLKINAALVKASPAIGMWAERCAVALGYVHTIGAAGLLQARTLANADRAGAACQALANDPVLTVADAATQIARALTTLQQSAQVK